MRDINRIHRILEKLERLWRVYPDQRLGQLIENYVIPSREMRGQQTCWLFYKEDDEAEANLDKILGQKEKKAKQ